jgi:hypothetical protein
MNGSLKIGKFQIGRKPHQCKHLVVLKRRGESGMEEVIMKDLVLMLCVVAGPVSFVK